MVFKDHSLYQMDEAYLESLAPAQLLEVSRKLLQDLKEARERVNQNPSNSSVPPSARAPWLSNDEGDEGKDEDEELVEEAGLPHDDAEEPAPPEEGAVSSKASVEARQPPPAPSTDEDGAKPKNGLVGR